MKAVGQRVDEVVQEDVVLMKVDVEGLETAVMASSQDLLHTYRSAVPRLTMLCLAAVLRCASLNHAVPRLTMLCCAVPRLTMLCFQK